MKRYTLFKQITAIHDNNSYYLYNWFNDIGVSIDKENIKSITEDEIVFFDYFEEENIKFLENNFFILKKDLSLHFYEKEFLKQTQREDGCLHLILLPSGYSCNFRCLYCYENHNNNSPIFNEVHSDYIIAFLKKNIEKKIHIEYFGGEPLLNYPWIIDFQKKICSIKHNASMTTNGYLLSKEKMSSLLKSNIRSYQITIDGHEDTHNKLRPKCDGSATYSRIMKNISEISTLKEDFQIILRCNFNSTNSQPEQRKIFFESISHLKNDHRFKLIFRPIGLYSEGNKTTNKNTQEAYFDDKDNIQNVWELEALDQGFLLGDIFLYTQIGGSICYASKKTTITLTPNMEILKCTIAVDQEHNKFGFLKQNDIDIDKNKIKKWEEFTQFDKECTKCFFFFQCMGRSCPLANLKTKHKQCPIKKDSCYWIVDKIRKQKRLLQRIKDEKNIQS